jgi:4-diphosphocytidyl-2-C-methyl-D-erythritol kinase
MITLRAYAKLNLALAVTGVRADGYHELDTIMQSISLYDTVTVEKAQGIKVTMDKPWASEQSNAAYKAAAAFINATGSGGALITINKNIPRMAGLGGASADAAAALIGLNKLYGSPLTKDALLGISASIGADVPFALTGGTARARGIGEKLTPLKPEKPFYYAVAKPFDGVSTAQAFEKYTSSGHISMDGVEFAVVKGDISLFARYSDNALGLASLAIAPGILKAAAALKAAGALKAFMTGSGSAVFSVFETFEAAKNAAQLVGGGFELCGAFAPTACGVEITGENL